jgi:CRP-like cAMP-binding protein
MDPLMRKESTASPMDTQRQDYPLNQLLTAMPRAAYEKLQPLLETVPLKAHATLIEGGAPLPHVYFPHSGMVCVISSLSDGVAETGSIGSEGLVGIEAVLGGDSATGRTLVQLEGTAGRVAIQPFRALVKDSPPLQQLLLRYVRFFLTQTLQSVACNALHAVEERCARWLLMAHDRVGRREGFHLTQEFLADMLGVHRPSVTIVARTLQNAGLIRYSRGVIVIADRKGLEEVACECYGLVRRALDSMLAENVHAEG